MMNILLWTLPFVGLLITAWIVHKAICKAYGLLDMSIDKECPYHAKIWKGMYLAIGTVWIVSLLWVGAHNLLAEKPVTGGQLNKTPPPATPDPGKKVVPPKDEVADKLQNQGHKDLQDFRNKILKKEK